MLAFRPGRAAFWVGLCALMISIPAQAAPAAEFPVSARQMQALGIRVATLQASGGAIRTTFPAQVVLPPSQEQVVSAPVGGLVTRVLVQPNQPVRAGQPLLQLSSPELGPLQLQLQQAASRARLARQTASRERNLNREGITPLRRVQEAEANLSEAEAALQQARAALRLAGLSAAAITQVERSGKLQDNVTVSARQAGTVLALEARLGQRVAAADPLLRLASLKELWLDIQVPVQEAARWQPGTRVLVPGREASARILSLSPAVAGGSQTVALRAVVESGTAQLRPGEFVQVALPLASGPDAWDLPLAAVVRDRGQAYVFVRTRAGFTARPVTVLGSADQRVRVRGPLKAGEQVAVAGVAALKAAWQGDSGGGE
ncbi:MAG: efflux RND transporter periplasmic adaptor subunit [Pseudomonadota bacterium]|uniref:efflux RND transporter periplasmic adaptor subunit n=1 Tax=Thermithiobacillus tepidarius TaxID=929 RepID=UPI0009DC0F49|nr:efflux RND transporter periplasmic adaptor subunit [Thermithiobacillus tepidarius]